MEKSEQTKLQETPPDVVLFHEFLHYVRYLKKFLKSKVKYLYNLSREEKMILCETSFPLEVWIRWLSDAVVKKVNVQRSTIGKVDKIFQINRLEQDDPYSKPWKIIAGESVKLGKTDKIDQIISILTNGSEPFSNLGFTDPKEYKNFSVMCVDREEIRNIIGDGDDAVDPIDKICENGYRQAQDLPLRYGHTKDSCIINPIIIRWARNCLDSCLSLVRAK